MDFIAFQYLLFSLLFLLDIVELHMIKFDILVRAYERNPTYVRPLEFLSCHESATHKA